MTTEDIYIPTGAVRLSEESYQSQLRIGIQGFPKTGKTYSAVSFPNPIFLSYDRGLITHIGRQDIVEIPFYDNEFINKLCPKTAPQYADFFSQQQKVRPSNRKDALIKWLETEGQKLTSKQTLILDGNTSIQSAFHQQYWVSPQVDTQGKIKPYAEYKFKIDYFTEIMTLLKSFKCNVIYLCHEAQDRDDKGNLNGGITPLISGAFKDELASHFTDWFRAHSVSKPPPEKRDDFKKWLGINDDKIVDSYINSTPSNVQTIFLWQTQPDTFAKCGTSLIGAPKYVLAEYATFGKYNRKTTT